jgi:putative ABC transport system permease protein
MRRWDDYGSMALSIQYALTGTSTDAVIIGTGVARMLQLCAPLKVDNCPPAPEQGHSDAQAAPDDIAALSALESQGTPTDHSTHIEMLAANVHGAPNVVGLNVVKAENWGLKEFDDTAMVMHLAQAQKLIFGGAAPQVTAIQIQLQHTDQIPQARARLEALLASQFKDMPLEILDFDTLTPIYGQSIRFFDSVFGFIATLIGVIVLFTVGNTMSMAVVERTTEIGTLRAMGQRRGGIRALFMCEGLLLGLLGAVLGVLTALLLAWVINHAGLTWTPPGYVFAYPLKVRVWGDPGLIFECAAGLVIVAVLSAWWPANRAAKLMIVDALRHV